MSAAFMPIAAISQNNAPSPTSSIAPQASENTQTAASKPMSRALKAGIAVAVISLSLIGLLFALRAWRASNLFDREYYFRRPNSVVLRLGAKKSGGCMATISFRDRPGTIVAADSRREDS
jgi:hypothetical protein